MIPSGMVPQQPQTSEPGEGSGVMQPFQPQEGQTVQMVDQAKLMEVLTSIQDKLSSMPAAPAGSMEEVERLDISQSLGEILQSTSGDENVVSAVDRQSSDIINLVSLLYEAIWQDNSVPIPIKELIGRTQVTIIRVALADVDFFNNENHPARAILNEFASAGLGWTEVEELEKDPLYQKMQELVERILLEYTGDNSLFDELIQDFRAFRAKEAAKTRQLEQRILKATERKDRIDDINELVTQKIEERILGRELDPFIEELLRGPFHKFMVMLVVKEGPGSSAWKQSVNTIDVLLWSVQRHDESGDRDRLTTVRPRLINNLRKAFRIAGIDKDEIDQLILQLERVQNESFGAEADEEPATEEVTEAGESAASEAEPETEEDTDSETSEPKVHFLAAGEEPEPVEDKTEVAADSTAAEVQDAEEEAPAEDEAGKPDELAEDDPHMVQVENLAVGQWVEFAGEDDENNSRCKLAAKINAIDKLIFVNRQGIKIAEKTKMGLALELRDGTVSIVSDGLLFSRALESVIGNLRESQHEQQTGSAYQPGEVAENS